jgi:ABC-type Fe3+-hydroxamate transport system substrate-binding protein
MKKLAVLILAALASVAFGQVSTTTTETTAPAVSSETTTTTYTAGTVTTYEPGQYVVVQSDEGPVRFALGTAAKIVGNIANGGRVKVYYNGPDRVVERVEVIQ